ncbi:uncharacterized protein LOC126376267 [Pectinophora gossypiella]|uniref:uncharacterized protein LOC126376267 n=1 Tax=Pectinophora gossypiella TaxID=13191 RepID=UPI00214E41CD|nr:uncharacterized protein LOC126376267 [Pectinophora gossypiella]
MPLLPDETDIPNKILIEEVRKTPNLYDKTLPGYMKGDLKRKLWFEIAEKLFQHNWNIWSKMQRREAVLAIQKRWGNLRTCFAREVKKRMKMKGSNVIDDDKKYRYYDQMMFLCKFLAIKTIENEYDSVSQIEDNSVYEDIDNDSIQHNITCESNESDRRSSTFEGNKSDQCNTFEINVSDSQESDKEDWQEEYVEQYLEDSGDIAEHRDDSDNDTVYEISEVPTSILQNEEVYAVVNTDLGDPLDVILRKNKTNPKMVVHLNDAKRRKEEHADDVNRRKVEHVDDASRRKVEHADYAKRRKVKYVDDTKRIMVAHADDAKRRKVEHTDDAKRRKVEHAGDGNKRKVEQVDEAFRRKVEVDDASSVNQDTNFALSLVPMLKGLPLNKKIRAQIEILKVFQRITENDM